MNIYVVLTCVSVLVLFLFLRWRRARKVRKMCDSLKEALNNHDYSFRLSTRDYSGANAVLISTINDMMERISAERQNIEVHSWEKLTRILTHEIMNSITPITALSSTFMQRKDVRESDIYKGIKAIHDTSAGLLDFVDEYRKFTALQKPHPDYFSIRDMLMDVQELGLVPDDVVLYLKFDCDNEMIYADRNLIRQVVINIVKNAVESFSRIPEHPVAKRREKLIQIFAYQYVGTAMKISISNNGAMIPEDVASDIFVPFFTTKKNGSGIGLSLCRQIMLLSGGSITLLPPGTNGWPTTFLLEFVNEKK